ncbi:MAG: hypothetical protein IKM45_03570 [Opitutales bacterium]|nr:hypothetical protein [Opitutales bacterium]
MKYFKYLLIGLIGLLSAITAGAQSRRGVETVPASETETVTFRCAFWEKPASAPQLFVKEGRNYVYLNVLKMAFARPYKYRGALPIPIFRKATQEEIAQRKAEGVKAADLEYIPLFSVNPRGLKDIGVIFLPGALEKKTDDAQLVFDYSEKAFPYGTVRVLNFSGRPLLGRLIPQTEEEKSENFRLKNRDGFLSKPFEGERRIYEIQLAAIVNKKPVKIYSSAAAFYKTNRVLLFIVPKDTQSAKDVNAIPKLDFRMLKDQRPLAPVSAETATQKNATR